MNQKMDVDIKSRPCFESSDFELIDTNESMKNETSSKVSPISVTPNVLSILPPTTCVRKTSIQWSLHGHLFGTSEQFSADFSPSSTSSTDGHQEDGNNQEKDVWKLSVSPITEVGGKCIMKIKLIAVQLVNPVTINYRIKVNNDDALIGKNVTFAATKRKDAEWLQVKHFVDHSFDLYGRPFDELFELGYVDTITIHCDLFY